VRVRVEREKRTRGKVERKRARKLSKRYNKQSCYIVQLYDPSIRAPVGIIPVRTLPTLKAVLKDLESQGLYPLILPQPVYVPQRFWELYRKASKGEKTALAKEYGLLKDSSIYRFETVVIDIDSPFESVYPAWEELKERLNLRHGYQVYRTKSGRFRAYIYLLDGTKDLKRAKELVAIIYAYFESKGLNPDPSFVHRLNHPVFYEEFPLYDYRLVEEEGGRIHFFRLYRSVKKLQKELKLYTFKGRNLTEEIWGRKPPAEAEREKRECRIVKAPAFVRKLEREKLDVFELWKRAVVSLSRKHTSYRYTYVIQPAVGWAKYLELSESQVNDFLVELLGESKRKDVEKGWKYARELEFTVPESVKWAGRTREEWEGEAVAYLQFKREVSRQELLKEVFANQKWLCDLIMDGLVSKGLVAFSFVVHGRGRPRKVYSLTEEARIPLRRAVGFDWIDQETLELSRFYSNKQNFVVGGEPDFSQENNSLEERAMGGGWIGAEDKREEEGILGGVGVGEVPLSRESFSLTSSLSFYRGSGVGCSGESCVDGVDGEDDDILVQLWEAGLIDF